MEGSFLKIFIFIPDDIFKYKGEFWTIFLRYSHWNP